MKIGFKNKLPQTAADSPKKGSKLIDLLKSQQVIGDPLNYIPFEFEDGEWDNVATVVPKFSVYLEKYLHNLSTSCRNSNEKNDERLKTLDEKVDD